MANVGPMMNYIMFYRERQDAFALEALEDRGRRMSLRVLRGARVIDSFKCEVC